MGMINLKPCPFCGSEKVRLFAYGGGGICVKYLDCDCQTGVYTDYSLSNAEKDSAAERVLRAWDQRAPIDRKTIGEECMKHYRQGRRDEARACGHEETYFDLLTIINGLKNVETIPANSALDHIHNVVTENAFNKGYDEGHKEGYERGKADAAISANILAKRLTAKFDDVLSVADVLEELETLEADAKGE